MSVLTAGDFTPHIGKEFQPAGAATALTLVKIETMAPGFILIFQSLAKEILPEGLYDFTIEDNSSYAFHVMPIHTPVPGHQDYQAVFN